MEKKRKRIYTRNILTTTTNTCGYMRALVSAGVKETKRKIMTTNKISDYKQTSRSFGVW